MDILGENNAKIYDGWIDVWWIDVVWIDACWVSDWLW